jgi:hypothetical protein
MNTEQKVCRASAGDHLPNAPVLLGKPGIYRQDGKWSWSYVPPGNHLSSYDKNQYAQGFLEAIAVPSQLQGLGLLELVIILVPADKQP